jgi:hypothetical protein
MEDNEIEDDGRITFYYSREERLKRAPQTVRDINELPVHRRKGLFRTLTATRPLAFLFISMITLCVAIGILSWFLSAEAVRTLGNNSVTVSVFGAEDKSYITVKKAVSQAAGGTYTGAVDIAVSVSNTKNSGSNSVYTQRVYFTPEQEEEFRFPVPFSGKKILVLVEAGTERALFTVTSK